MPQPVNQPSNAPWRVLEEPEVPGGTAEDDSPSPGNQAAPAVLPAASAQPWLGVATMLAAAGFLLGVAFLLAGSGKGVVEVSSVSGTLMPVGAAPSAVGIVVEVVGAVQQPGVYSLPAGARVGDVVAAAGGYGPRVDAARAEAELNLAAVLRDGERIRVPSRDDPIATDDASTGAGPGQTAVTGQDLVNINRATATELDALPGIGPATSAKIIAAREEQPFTSVDDLLARKLVSSRVMESIRPLISIR